VYAHPGGEIRNSAGRLPGVADPLPGGDLRGDGGYTACAADEGGLSASL